MIANNIYFQKRLVVVALMASAIAVSVTEGQEANPESRYTFLETPSRDGIGKVYLGREIAQVMGHLGAGWLERPEREQEEKPALLVKSLNLQPGATVADIGAGTGYFSWRLARAVGEEGKVYAVDIQQEMLELLQTNMEKRDIHNVAPVLGEITDPTLPENSIDLALMVDVYHEFSYPFEMMEAIVRSLKSGGRVVWVEYRAEDPAVPIKPLHKMTEAQVKKEARALDLEFVETINVLPRQHIVIFKKNP